MIPSSGMQFLSGVLASVGAAFIAEGRVDDELAGVVAMAHALPWLLASVGLQVSAHFRSIDELNIGILKEMALSPAELAGLVSDAGRRHRVHVWIALSISLVVLVFGLVVDLGAYFNGSLDE